MQMRTRLAGAAGVAALVAALAGPGVGSAAAATTVAPAATNPNPVVELLDEVTSEVAFDISPSNIQAILGDLPLFPPYGL